MKQNDIAAALNLSPSKVNRLIAQGRNLGMVKVAIESPFQLLVEIEKQMAVFAGLAKAVVTPTVIGSPDSTLQRVGRAAANQLLEMLRDGDVIAITGGKAVSAIVENLEPERTFDITVVPLTGGVQGKFYTDVNHLATRLAERLGGSALLLHAPCSPRALNSVICCWRWLRCGKSSTWRAILNWHKKTPERGVSACPPNRST